MLWAGTALGAGTDRLPAMNDVAVRRPTPGELTGVDPSAQLLPKESFRGLGCPVSSGMAVGYWPEKQAWHQLLPVPAARSMPSSDR